MWDRIKGYYSLFRKEFLYVLAAVCIIFCAAVVALLGAASVLVIVVPFVVLTAIWAGVMPFWARNSDPFDFRRVNGFFDKKKKRSIDDFAEYTGLSPADAERFLTGLLDLHAYTFAYHPSQRLIYVYLRSSDMDHCPNCAADFFERYSGKCTNCRVVFSRMELHRPFHYL